MESVRCPGCASAMGRVVDGGVRYECPACHGHLVGLAPFENLHPGHGRRLWVAAEGGQTRGRCPFCSRDLLVPVAPDAPPGLTVCRLCEQVWVPVEAEAALRRVEAAWAGAGAGGVVAGAAVEAGPSRTGHADRCPQCGAPWAPDPAGCCRFCKEQLADGSGPTTVIIEGAPHGRGAGTLGALLGAFERDW